MSSLAAQLSSIASLDASRLGSRTGAPSSKSYLFSAKVASHQDLEEVFALAQAGFDELLELDPELAEFENELFSDSAKRNDRTQLNPEENDALDIVLGRCLRRLGRWIGTMAGGKCLEWLVRRFRVHEMNSETLIQTFLPYHESPNFARMLAILSLPTTSVYHAPFSPLIKSAQPVPRSYIVQAISPSREPSLRLLQDVVNLPKIAAQEGCLHRALLAFWSGALVELIEKGKAAKGVEGIVKALVEAFIDLLGVTDGGEDLNAAVYPPLITLVRAIRLADEPLLAILEALLTPKSGANVQQRLMMLSIILQDRPGWTLGLGENASEKLHKIKRAGVTMVTLMEKHGFEVALSTILPILIERPELHQKALNRFVESASLPNSLVVVITNNLLSIGSSSATTEALREICKSLLAALRERHPATVDAAFVAASSSTPNAASLLTHPTSTSTDLADVYSADVSARVQGIKRAFRTLEDIGAGDEEKAGAKSALMARLADEEVEIIQALYTSPKAMLSAIDPAEYITAVQPCFSADHIKVAVASLHVDFLRDHLLPSHPGSSRVVFEAIVFPTALTSKSREADLVPWLSADPKHKGDRFGGILEKISHDRRQSSHKRKSVGGGGDVEDNNEMLVRLLSDAYSSSTASEADISYLISQLESARAPSRCLALLVLTQILRSSPPELRIQMASRALPAINQRLAALVTPPIEYEAQGLYKMVFKHPKSGRTEFALIGAFLSSIKEIKAPAPQSTHWMTSSGSAHDFRALAIGLYNLIHSGLVGPTLSADLLRHLLTQLGNDSLLFFASIWTSLVPTHLKSAALKHGKAFVSAHLSGGVDFQLIIPALLVALQDLEKEVRSSGVSLLRVIARTAQGAGGGSVYALDDIYGPKSKKVQILKSSDLAPYLGLLEAAGDDIIIDPSRLAFIHSTELATAGKGRKEVQHRRAIITSLLSHLVGWQSLSSRLSILSSLSGVHDTSVLRGVLPLLTPLLSPKSDEYRWLSHSPAGEQERYLVLLVSALSKQSAGVLADTDAEAWKFVLHSISSDHSSGVFAGKLRTLVLERLVDGVWDVLAQHQKVPLIRALIQSLRTASIDDSLATRAILARLSLDSAEIIAILHDLAAPLDPQSTRKRQKQDSASSDRVDDAVGDITALIESRDWSSLPGDASLVAALMEVLSNLLAKKQYIHEGLDYLEQELLAGILSNLEKISDRSALQRARVGIEVIIKVIRASSNPRTWQRALLVASELARLIPEAVLHNVMPIFTFMGASDFQRDDAYSFGVVEKTVARIVPVMTRSLHGKHKDRLGLYKESMAFLGIFTDMVGRLPKHRTLPFFVHLVKSLGEEFLPAVVMLLLERASRRPGGASALEMALGLVGAFELPARLGTLQEIVEECSRLVLDLGADIEQRNAFLSQLLSEDDDSIRIIAQVTMLLEFEASLAESLARKACDQEIVRGAIKKFILLSSSSEAAVRKPALTALGATMKLLAASEFLGITRDVLAENDPSTTVAALEIYSSRIPAIKKEARAASGAAISEITKSCGGNLSNGAVAAPALAALKVTVSSALPSEDGAIAATVPKLVAAIKSSSATQASALDVLDIAIKHLGPRIIPYIQSILDTILPLCLSPTTAKSGVAILRSLLTAIPTFISAKQLTSILQTGLAMRKDQEKLSKALWYAITDKIATKTLFPVVMDLYQTLGTAPADEEVMEAFFHLLQLTLRNASDGAISALVKPVFNFFLEVFDTRHRLRAQSMSPDVIDRIEGSAIGSFLALVTKLNETTFRPLFTRLYDWAVIDLAAGKSIDDPRLIERKIVLLHVMDGLLEKFKHLLSPYIGIMLPHIEELLSAYRDEEIADTQLWALLLQVLGKSFEVDDGAYWTEALFKRLIPLLVAQVALFPSITTTPDSPIASCLAAMAGGTTSEPIIKSLNSSVCLLTRRDDVSVRLAALRVLDATWAKAAEEMIGLVPETVSEFLAELIEDESSEVESLARGVLARIEKTTGSLKEYLE